MNKIISLCVSLLGFACMTCRQSSNVSNFHFPHEVVSDTARELVVGISIYDTIAPPKLITDSTKLYEQLEEVLDFPTGLKSQDEYKTARYEFIIGTDGQTRERERKPWVVEGVGTDMNKVIDLILTTKWEPAFLKEAPLKRIPCLIDVVLKFYRDRIEFEVYAPQYYNLLRRTYNANNPSRK